MAIDWSKWKRTWRQEIELRCALVDGVYIDEQLTKIEDMLGSSRASRQVPVSLSGGVFQRMLSVTAILYDRCAMSGMDPEFARLLSAASSPGWRAKLAAVDLAPIPTGLVQGGGDGGLTDNLRYLQACEHGAIQIGFSERSQRPYIRVVKPSAVAAKYMPDDPLSPVRGRVARTRMVGGEERDVIDEWDVSDLGAPRFRVLESKRENLEDEDLPDITIDVDAFRRDLSRFSGSGYWWRYTQAPSKGRPYMPLVIYGSPHRAMRGVSIAEGSLESGVLRTSAMSSHIDGGFRTREVVGLIVAQDANVQTGQGGATQGPGDVRIWTDTGDATPGRHFSFDPAADSEMLFRVCRQLDHDLATQLGFPLELTSTGGAPLDHEIEAQRRAIRRWYDIARAGDSVLMRRLAATANAALGTSYAESGYSPSYLDELDEILTPAAPVVADTETTS